jgi:hypothetical protein
MASSEMNVRLAIIASKIATATATTATTATATATTSEQRLDSLDTYQQIVAVDVE